MLYTEQGSENRAVEKKKKQSVVLPRARDLLGKKGMKRAIPVSGTMHHRGEGRAPRRTFQPSFI